MKNNIKKALFITGLLVLVLSVTAVSCSLAFSGNSLATAEKGTTAAPTKAAAVVDLPNTTEAQAEITKPVTAAVPAETVAAPVTVFENPLNFKNNQFTLNGITTKFTQSQKTTEAGQHSSISYDVYTNSTCEVEFYSGTTRLKGLSFLSSYPKTSDKVLSRDELRAIGEQFIKKVNPDISDYFAGSYGEDKDGYTFYWCNTINGLPTNDNISVSVRNCGDIVGYYTTDHYLYKQYESTFAKVKFADYRAKAQRQFASDDSGNESGGRELLSDGILVFENDIPCVALKYKTIHYSADGKPSDTISFMFLPIK